MHRRTILALGFAFFAATAWAAPFLVCDPPASTECVTAYEVTLGGATVETPAPLHYDLSGVQAGDHSVEVRAVCVSQWGRLTSYPAPFAFSRPGSPGVPTGIGIVAN